MKIGIIEKLNGYSPHTAVIRKRFLDGLFLHKGKDVQIGLYSNDLSNDNSVKYDLLLSLGGDGTVIAALKIGVKLDVPVLGINLGTVGFLTPSTIDTFFDIFEGVLGGWVAVKSLKTIDRSLLNIAGS